MKFGIFLPNVSDGYILSTATPTYTPSFEHCVSIAKEAERSGLDFILSVVKYKGFGGETGYWDHCLESFVLTGAMAAQTSRINFIASVGIPSIHPGIVARMMATLDDISQGRCSLNIVAGWSRPEYDQMGMWPADNYHSFRYEYARDYVTVVRKLWEPGNANYHSKFFSLTDCACLPKPRTKISIVSAGKSPKGIEFTAEFADYSFVFLPDDRIRVTVAELAAKASEFGRTVGTLLLYTLVAAGTDEEAKRLVDEMIENADHVAIGNMIASAELDSNVGGISEGIKEGTSLPPEEGNMTFMSIPVIYGSYETVARRIDELSEIDGIEGIVWTFADFVSGIRLFHDEVMPRLTCIRGRVNADAE